MNAARQIANRMLDELPDEMLINVISYIAFINKEKRSEVFKDMADASFSSIGFWNNQIDDEVWNGV